MIRHVNYIAELWWGWMWPMFWQVGILIAIVAAVDLVIRRKIWPQVRYALWLLVLVKLVLPPTLISPASLTSHIPLLFGKVIQTQFGPLHTPADITSPELFTTYDADYSGNSEVTVPIVDNGGANSLAAAVARAASTLSPKGYAFALWLLGVVVLGSWLVLRLKRLRKNTVIVSDNQTLPEWFYDLLLETAGKLNLQSVPQVVVSSDICCPAIFGLFRPVLLMPAERMPNLSRTEAEHILLHELSHIKRGDLAVHAVYATLQIIYWFNPLVWLIRKPLQNLRELCCDGTVARILKENTFEYRRTLLETARQLLAEPVVPGLGLLGLFENSGWIVDRLKWLERQTWKHRSLRIVVTAAVITLMSVCILPMAKASDAASEKVTKSEEVSQNPTGQWQSVDYVQNVADFKPGVKSSQGELFLKEIEFTADGRTSVGFGWESDILIELKSNIKAQFFIKQIGNETYLFLPWLSGDVTIRGQKPWYYVLKKSGPARAPQPSGTPRGLADINVKVSQIDIDKASLEDVIRIFGEPIEYRWGQERFKKDKLPSQYVAVYPGGFQVCMSDGQIIELRFEHVDSGYVFAGKIRVGSSLDEVLEALGQPKETVQGKSNAFQDGVLYKDIEGRKGYCYYGRSDKGARLFFANYNVTALYVTRSGYDAGGGGSFQTVRPVDSVKEFDDVRWKDLSKLPIASVAEQVRTFSFNKKTIWPDAAKFPAASRPEKILKEAMNPGLNVRRLHREGVTGRGVNVAIIDQPLYQDHPEFAGKIADYFDTGCKSESSMHGPAVTSLLVGTNCGTAPDARVYYVAAPSWLKDSAYYAKALDWIVEQNAKLPAGQKIRVVSISAAPSGQGSPFDKNQQMWDQACARAEAAGILVIDCTAHHGFISSCWLDTRRPEDVASCSPGYPGLPTTGVRGGNLLVPTSPRTTAEEYNKGQFSYQYNGRGGLSWAIPYAAGVLAMGWQIKPDLTAEQMKQLLFDSAYTNPAGRKIINPSAFIAAVKKTR